MKDVDQRRKRKNPDELADFAPVKKDFDFYLQEMWAWTKFSKEISNIIWNLILDTLYVRFDADFVYSVLVWFTGVSIYVIRHKIQVQFQTQDSDTETEADDLCQKESRPTSFYVTHLSCEYSFHQVGPNCLCVFWCHYDSKHAYSFINDENGANRVWDFADLSDDNIITGAGCSHILAFQKLHVVKNSNEEVWKVWLALQMETRFQWTEQAFPTFMYDGPKLQEVLLCSREIVVFVTNHPQILAVLCLRQGKVELVNLCDNEKCFATFSCVACLSLNDENVLIVVSKYKYHKLFFHIVNLKTKIIQHADCAMIWHGGSRGSQKYCDWEKPRSIFID